MTPNLSDGMNLAVTQNSRGHDPGHPRMQKTNSCSVLKFLELYRPLIQESKQIGS